MLSRKLFAALSIYFNLKTYRNIPVDNSSLHLAQSMLVSCPT
jgi:hypothetical protein